MYIHNLIYASDFFFFTIKTYLFDHFQLDCMKKTYSEKKN